MLSVILGVITRIFANSYSNVLQKQLTNSGERSSAVNFYTYLGLSVISLVVLPKPILTAELFIYIVLMGIAGALGNYFIIKALSCGELSVLAPINSYKPVVGMVIALFVLKETPAIFDILGLMLIIAGTFLLVSGGKTNIRSIMYRVWALIFSGCEAVFIKKIILISNIESAFMYWALSGLFFAFLLCIKNGFAFSRVNIRPLIVLILSVAIMQYSTNFVFSKIPVSHALALFQLSVLLSVVFGVNIFKEKNLLKKLIASLIMILGAIVLLI